MKRDDARSGETKVGNDSKWLIVAETLVFLAAMALVAFLVVVLPPANLLGIAEVIAAAGGLLAAAAQAVRGIRGR
jgi:hypothetical protein